MAKAVTMRNVASLAGVSQATVSYVLNGKEKSRLPKETIDKVKDAARILGYRFASEEDDYHRDLCRSVALIYKEPTSFFDCKLLMDFFEMLSARLKVKGKKLKVLPDADEAGTALTHCVVALGLNEKRLEELRQNRFVTLIALNTQCKDAGLFNVSLSFSRVQADYEKAMAAKPNGAFLFLPFGDGKMTARFQRAFPMAVRIDNVDAALQWASTHRGTDAFAVGKPLGQFLAKIPSMGTIRTEDTLSREMIEAAVRLMDQTPSDYPAKERVIAV